MEHTKKLQFIIITCLFVMGFVFQSCSSVNTPKSPTVPTLTIAPLDIVRCSDVTPIPPPILKQPKVVYVLLDRSGSYGAFTQRAADILIEGLILSVEPGDRLHLIWLGASEGDEKNWLVGTVPMGDYPQLLHPIPTLTPTLLPSPVPSPTESSTPRATYAVLEQQSMTQTATAQFGFWTVTAHASSVIVTNTAIQTEKDINKQRCDQKNINDQNQALVDDFQRQRVQLVKDFIDNILSPLKSAVPRGNDSATHIYNSLFYAARTIRNEKETGQFRSYNLIILSDMEDAGSRDGQRLNVDLSNVNVLMAMVYCEESIDCQNRSHFWEKYFRDRGALLPVQPFRLLGETTPYVISDFLK